MTGPYKRRDNERGEGSWGNLLMLIGTTLLAIATFSAGPVFLQNFKLEDKLTNISRTFPPGEEGNVLGREAVAKAIEELEMTEFVNAEEDCSVTSQGTIGGSRTVTCKYTREYNLLPGMKRKYNFAPSATSPTF